MFVCSKPKCHSASAPQHGIGRIIQNLQFKSLDIKQINCVQQQRNIRENMSRLRCWRHSPGIARKWDITSIHVLYREKRLKVHRHICVNINNCTVVCTFVWSLWVLKYVLLHFVYLLYVRDIYAQRAYMRTMCADENLCAESAMLKYSNKHYRYLCCCCCCVERWTQHTTHHKHSLIKTVGNFLSPQQFLIYIYAAARVNSGVCRRIIEF